MSIDWMALAPVFLLGALLGLLIGLGVGLARSRNLEIRRAAEIARAEERLQLQAEAAGQQEEVFRGVAAEALRTQSEQFLQLAEQRLATARAEAGKDLEQRQTAVAQLVKPLQETLGRLETKTAELERERGRAYGELDKHLRILASQTQGLSQSTTELSTALRGTTAGGQWGEMALRNLVELAGMTEHVDFHSQETLESGGRPDLVVNLPGGRRIAVDAKAPVSPYLDVLAGDAQVDPSETRAQLAKTIRTQVQRLAARGYAEQLVGEIDYVVLFLPTDGLLAEAFKADRDLQVDAYNRNVMLVTPTILVALLRTVAFEWQRNALEKNVEEIGDLAATLIERTANYANNLSELGTSLDRAVTAFNRAANSFRTRIRPLRRQLTSLTSGDEPTKKEPQEIGQRVLEMDSESTGDWEN